MSPGYLTTIASRTLREGRVLAPRVPSRFEPRGGRAWAAEDGFGEAPAEPSPAVGGPEEQLRESQAALRLHDPEPLFVPRSRRRIAHELRPEPGFRPAAVEDPHAGDDAAHAADAAPGIAGLAHPLGAGEERAQPASARSLPLVAGSSEAAPSPPADRAALVGRSAAEPALQPRPVDAQPARPPRSEPVAEPTVVVRIGRIDVRAVHTPAPAVTPPAAPQPPAMSLADHLQARDAGRR
jgi:hypothetical protein